MLAIDNKEAGTVAIAIFENWVCKFGTPLEFVSDNGKEFCNNLAKELYALLQIKHSTTTPYWPQCNAQAEVANKTIQKYLASFMDKTTLDWPIYMAPWPSPIIPVYTGPLRRRRSSSPMGRNRGTRLFPIRCATVLWGVNSSSVVQCAPALSTAGSTAPH